MNISPGSSSRGGFTAPSVRQMFRAGCSRPAITPARQDSDSCDVLKSQLHCCVQTSQSASSGRRFRDSHRPRGSGVPRTCSAILARTYIYISVLLLPILNSTECYFSNSNLSLLSSVIKDVENYTHRRGYWVIKISIYSSTSLRSS